MFGKEFFEEAKSSKLVSSGRDWPLEWHKFATNDTEIVQNLLSSGGSEAVIQNRFSLLSSHPSLRPYLTLDFFRHAESTSYVEADARLRNLDERLRFGNISFAESSAGDIKAYCVSLARQIEVAGQNSSASELWEFATRIAKKHDITPPDYREFKSALGRFCDPSWWFRQAEQRQAQVLDATARDLGIVQNARQSYVSNFATKRRHFQKINHRRFLESSMLIKEDGEEISLWEVQEHSVSNPAIRRAELMVRIKGFEMVAEAAGHIGEFLTMSAPGQMHASLKHGPRNPKFDGSTPGDVQKYFNHIWSLIRAELHRQGIQPYGFRVVEPHHDGTPHWHMLLFMPPKHADQVRAICRKYALQKCPDEKGAEKYRFKATQIDPEKGSAAGYIAKYIAKNIDGEFLDSTLEGHDAKESSNRIEAWSRTWNIRQFQQIGGPSVTVWRELRRLRNGVDAEDIQEAHKAADASDWAAYCWAMGGIGLSASDRPIKPLYEDALIVDTLTGEVLSERRTRYGDLSAPRLIGLQSLGQEIRTRNNNWRVVHGKAPPGT